MADAAHSSGHSRNRTKTCHIAVNDYFNLVEAKSQPSLQIGFKVLSLTYASKIIYREK